MVMGNIKMKAVNLPMYRDQSQYGFVMPRSIVLDVAIISIMVGQTALGTVGVSR